MTGLEALAYLSKNGFLNIPIPQGNESDEHIDDYAIECGYTIENELKAFEIIKNKRVVVISVPKGAEKLTEHNYYIVSACAELTKEEFDLLKEELENGENDL